MTSAAPVGPKVPAAPPGVSITSLFEYGTTLRVEAAWQSPADNGSALTGFSLVLTSDRGFSRSFSLTAPRSGAVEIPCGTRCHGLRVLADLTAANANGQGVVVSGSLAETSRIGFSGRANFTPPFAWRTFEGTCTLNYTGPISGSRPVYCWATSLSFTFNGGAGNYRFWMQAGAIRSNEVRVYGYHEPLEPCPRC